MPDGLQKTVEEWREKGIDLSDEETDEIYRYCLRKMDVAKVKNPDEYIFLLFPDEIKNYLFRQAVNAATTILRMLEKEGGEDVFSLQTNSMPSPVS